MRRFFVKNILFIITINLLVKPVWVFMIDRTVQNRVGHDAYGLYQALLNICLIFQILLDFGLTSYNTNMISRNPEKLKTLYPSMLTVRLVLIGVFSLLVIVFGLSVGYKGKELGLLAAIMMIQVMSSLVLYLRSNVSASLRFKVDGVLSVMDRLLMIAICGFLLYYPATASYFKIEWFVYAQILCYGITAIVAFWAIYRIAHALPKLSFNIGELFTAIRKSFPYAIMVLLMSIHMRSDTVLIERLVSKDQAGIYASATRLLDLGNMFGILFAGVLLPMFGRMIAEKQSIQPLIKLSVNLLLPVAFMVSCIACFWGGDIMQTLYKNAGEYDGKVFSLVMASFPAYCIMYTYSTLLTANGNIALMNRISLAGAAISVSLNFYLIPQKEALGAAMTACITQTILAACYIIFCGKRLQLPHSFKWVSAHLCHIAILFAAGYFIHLTTLHWIGQVLLICLISVTSIVAFRFISLNNIQILLANKNNR
ncbi:MAG: oligosaccharide flippase family protein [Bacteroidetes bacterium]|nr:oligosaccharide flippase family protein [Bacteroidota bacterium]